MATAHIPIQRYSLKRVHGGRHRLLRGVCPIEQSKKGHRLVHAAVPFIRQSRLMQALGTISKTCRMPWGPSLGATLASVHCTCMYLTAAILRPSEIVIWRPLLRKQEDGFLCL
ncbi:hypothetical protein F442_13069 [Phytophthora nicotianae P10297]|uniref:Uncharacterized protein n=1 Tax=Phytophthora nicotianae P10297 TaxID=1317064 RepID=W2YWR5_PHYNI|nr:hypothetical protein F442_13069 [Phytophthora nicotianae P10297]